ncbi:MAG: hypothetical protein PHX10_04770, partial [Gallionellaceae bacterium]|nr:hypothetical protein [Gallionellaceae bacterium]
MATEPHQADDKAWLDDAQQAWDKRQEEEAKTAEASEKGEQVIVVADASGVTMGTGATLIDAPYSRLDDGKLSADDDKGAAPLPEEGGTLGGYGYVPLLLLVGVAAAAGGGGGGGSPADPYEFHVYSTEDPDGHRTETVVENPTPNSTQNGPGPYDKVLIHAFNQGDSAILSSDVAIDLLDGSSHHIEVWAQGDSSLASGDIMVHENINGAVDVKATGVSSDAELHMSNNSADTDNYYTDDVTVSSVMSVSGGFNVDATGDSSDAHLHMGVDAYVSSDTVSNDASLTVEAALTSDVTVEASGKSSDASASVDVTAEAYSVSVSGDLTVNADLNGDLSATSTGHDSHATVSADVSADVWHAWTSSDLTVEAGMAGALTVDADGKSTDANVDLDVGARMESSDVRGSADVSAHVSGAMKVDSAGEDSQAQLTVNSFASTFSSDVGADLTVNSGVSGNLSVTTGESGDANANVNVTAKAFSNDVAGNLTVSSDYVGDVTVQADGYSSDASAHIYVQASGDVLYRPGSTVNGDMKISASVSGDLSVTAAAHNTNADLEVDVRAHEIGTDMLDPSASTLTVEAILSGDVHATALSADSDAYASIGVYAQGEDSSVSGDVHISAHLTGSLTAMASSDVMLSTADAHALGLSSTANATISADVSASARDMTVNSSDLN